MTISPYAGKRFSVLGDSISTFEGYNPPEYNVFYNREKQKVSGVERVEDTWWKMVIDTLGGELLVNNSWSGSLVARQQDQESYFPSACSEERTASLHCGNAMPDVVLVFLGTNDWGFGVDIENMYPRDVCRSFGAAYSVMLEKLRRNYPSSEIWCCTLTATYRSNDPNYTFRPTYGGIHMEEYNAIIRQTAMNYQCRIADIYNNQKPCDTIDGLHPNRQGMALLAEQVIQAMTEK